jgi:TPP-dependent pyruvate/acetoin dehydrogenase alpha subunit
VASERIAALAAEVEAEVRAAVDAANADELPAPGDLETFLYA